MTRWIVICLIAVAAEAGVMSYCVFVQPDVFMEKIPTHWNIRMEPDAWTTREHIGWYLLPVPAAMLLMTALLALLPKISPKHFEVEPFADTFGFVITTVVVFFCCLGGLILWASIQESPYFAQVFVGSFFVLFAVLGNVMGKVQRNFWMGIRTPWTLASETVWNRTHRVAAWLWVAAGIVGAAGVMLGMPFWIAMALIVAATLVPVAYSLVLYKSLEKQGKL